MVRVRIRDELRDKVIFRGKVWVRNRVGDRIMIRWKEPGVRGQGSGVRIRGQVRGKRQGLRVKG